MTPEALRSVLEEVAARAARVGTLPDEAEGGAPAGPIFRPVDGRAAGVVADWVTPVVQRWAPQLDVDARDLAAVLAEGLVGERDVDAVEVAPSGLLAITLSDEARSRVIGTIGDEADSYALAASTVYAPVPDEVPGSRGTEDALLGAQRALARLCRLVRNAEAAGVELRAGLRLESLDHVSERLLLVALADLPQRLATHTGDRQQQVRAVAELGALADGWTHPLRPARIGEPVTSVHGARLALAGAAMVVLRNGLARLGASAPERM